MFNLSHVLLGELILPKNVLCTFCAVLKVQLFTLKLQMVKLSVATREQEYSFQCSHTMSITETFYENTEMNSQRNVLKHDTRN